MAPVTPSPHRFLPGYRRPPTPPKSFRRPAKSPRDADAPQENTSQVSSARPVVTPSQFAVAPRFSFGQPSPAVEHVASQRRPVLPSSLMPPAQRSDLIEESSTQEEDDDHDGMRLNDEGPYEAAPAQSFAFEQPKWTEELPLSPKRRRIDQGEPVSAFRRPAFIHRPPPTAPQEPVPDIFSPHRHGPAFVPGGLAATVQQWIIQTGQGAVATRRTAAGELVLKIVVEVVSGSGPYVVRGKRSDGENRCVLLSACATTTQSTVVVQPRSIVGIRAPVWETELDTGQTLTAAADWIILQA